MEATIERNSTNQANTTQNKFGATTQNTESNAEHPTIDKVTEKAHQTVDQAAQWAATATDWIGNQKDRVVQNEQQLIEQFTLAIRKQPLVAIGTALAAGFILSKIISR